MSVGAPLLIGDAAQSTIRSRSQQITWANGTELAEQQPASFRSLPGIGSTASTASYDPAINSTPSAANAMSSSEDKPLTATAPTTSPVFQTGSPPPHPTYLGSP